MLQLKYGSGVGEIVGTKVGVEVGSAVGVGRSVGVDNGVAVGTGISGAQDTTVNTAKLVINNNRLILSLTGWRQPCEKQSASFHNNHKTFARPKLVSILGEDYILMEKDTLDKSEG